MNRFISAGIKLASYLYLPVSLDLGVESNRKTSADIISLNIISPGVRMLNRSVHYFYCNLITGTTLTGLSGNGITPITVPDLLYQVPVHRLYNLPSAGLLWEIGEGKNKLPVLAQGQLDVISHILGEVANIVRYADHPLSDQMLFNKLKAGDGREGGVNVTEVMVSQGTLSYLSFEAHDKVYHLWFTEDGFKQGFKHQFIEIIDPLTSPDVLLREHRHVRDAVSTYDWLKVCKQALECQGGNLVTYETPLQFEPPSTPIPYTWLIRHTGSTPSVAQCKQAVLSYITERTRATREEWRARLPSLYLQLGFVIISIPQNQRSLLQMGTWVNNKLKDHKLSENVAEQHGFIYQPAEPSLLYYVLPFSDNYHPSVTGPSDAEFISLLRKSSTPLCEVSLDKMWGDYVVRVIGDDEV